MISFDNSKVTLWDKKVVYAPNSFGKTTSANEILKKYEEMGEKVDIFSRKKIESLISSFGGKFFMGKRAKLESNLAEIEDQIKKNKTLVNVFLGTSSGTAVNLKKNSFYCSFNEIKNIYSIPEMSEKNREKYRLLRQFNTEQIKILDRNLSIDLYKEVDKLISEIDEKRLLNRKIAASISNDEVSDKILEELQDIYSYCKFNKVSKCYLCGKNYKSHDSLIEHIEKRITELRINDSNEVKLNSLTYEILKLKEETQDEILKNIFNKKYNTPKKQFLLLTLYRNLCLCSTSFMHKEVLSSKVDDNESEEINTVKKLLVKKERINNKLLEDKKSKSQVEKYNKYIIDEMEKILVLNENIDVKPLQDKCGIEFKVDKKTVNPYDILSESEIKRLSLVVLKTEVRYQHIKTLILDDPIDSYDDYNKRIACQYISDLVGRKSLKHWYIFTNDFECVYYLSKCLKAPTIFYLQNIDSIFNKTSNVVEVECDNKQVGIIAKNDLYYLDYLVNRTVNKFEYDKDILFIALTLTLRNIKTDFINKYNNIEITKCLLAPKNNWKNHIEQFIEGYTEHYDMNNSPNVLIKDIAEPFYALATNHKSSVPAIYMANNNSFETYREKIAKSSLTISNTYVDVVNYLFKKVVIVNYLKYELEKKLINIVHSYFSPNDISTVESHKNGLGGRIAEALKLNNQNYYKCEKKLKKIYSIHNKYSSLYNAIDHGTTLLITPYLSTSVKDIENFKLEIENI